MPWVADEAPRPECARAELHPSRKPANNLAVREQTRDDVKKFVFIGVTFERCAVGREDASNLRTFVGGAEQASLLTVLPVHAAGRFYQIVADKQSRNQRAPRINPRPLGPKAI